MNAVIITNAGPDIGGGHLSRCFALSQALETYGISCSWILNEDASSQARAFGIRGKFFLRDIFSGKSIEIARDADFAVVDSYLAPSDFFRDISGAVKLVVIDDPHDKGVEFFANVVINYGLGASREFYKSRRCRYLLGPGYALLRREFWALEPEARDYVLFAPGAADVAGASQDMARLWDASRPELVIVLGPLVPERSRRAVAEISSGRENIKILHNPGDFPLILSRARLVICTASVTAYEALAMEKRLALFYVADNQKYLGGYLMKIGAARDLGDWSRMDPDKLEGALDFEPDRSRLRGLVRKDGARACAASVLHLLEAADGL
jgi:spore coat polysaccharide biosynthesis predicted glycosyltransferase SpsG